MVEALPFVVRADCEQSFHVFGKTAGESSVIYFHMAMRGECIKDFVYALHISGKDAKLFTLNGTDTAWVAGFLKSQPNETGVQLKDSAGVYRLDDNVLLAPPDSDPTFAERFNKLRDTTSGRAGDWRKTCRKGCFDGPKFANATGTLLYSHPSGIYKNYSISQAIWFPQSRLLVLVTHQPLKGKDGYGNHGVVVYRIDKQVPN